MPGTIVSADICVLTDARFPLNLYGLYWYSWSVLIRYLAFVDQIDV